MRPNSFMLKRLASGAAGTLAVVLAAAPAAAQMPFAPFGARAIGMGGAAIALPEGAASVVENPAAASDSRFEAAASAGGLATESGDFLSPLKLITGNDPAKLAAGLGNLGDVTRALRTLADPGNGILGDGRAGAAFTSRGWGLSVTETGWGGAFVRADLAHLSAGTDSSSSVLFNRSAAVFRSLVVEDVALSNAQKVGGGVLIVGATVHALRGTTSTKEESVFSTEVGDALQMARRSLTGAERTRTRFTWDAGALVTFGVLRVGGVVRAVNRPEFPFADSLDAPAADRGTSVMYGRQARVGASVHLPVVGLTFAADYDLLKSDTMIPGLESRELGGGAEWKIGPIAVRGGLAVNLEAPDRTKRWSAGVGVGIGPVHADAAVVYRPDRSALGAVLTARVGI